MKRAILLLLLLPLASFAQVSVSLSPTPKLQFLDNSGKPLANGCVSFFAGGTNTPQAAYTDSTGTAQLPNPLVLDAGGFASPGGIWLANQSYKIKVNAAAPSVTNCSSLGPQLYVIDNVSSTLGLLNLANTFTAANTFQQPVTITPNANQLILGAVNNQTTLNAPAPAGNIVINLPSIADTLVGIAATQTLTNKTLTSPILNNPNINGTVVSGPPATYLALSNDITTGTTANTLTKMLGATAVISATTDTGGAVGITVSGAGKAGNATIQQNGSVSCVFDGGTTAGDYVQISATVAGNCHDVGATYPTNGQIIGRAQLTAGGAGTYAMVLFGPEEKPVGVQIAAVANLIAQGANIANTTLITPSANGFYRMTCYEVVTQAATTSSTLPQCNLVFTDGDSSIAQSVNICTTSSSNLVGQICGPGSNSNALSFNAKTGVAIQYSTSGYASVGGTPMNYAVHVRLEGPF